MTARELARLKGCTKNAVIAAIHRCELVADRVRIGGMTVWQIDPESAEDWVPRSPGRPASV